MFASYLSYNDVFLPIQPKFFVYNNFMILSIEKICFGYIFCMYIDFTQKSMIIEVEVLRVNCLLTILPTDP